MISCFQEGGRHLPLSNFYPSPFLAPIWWLRERPDEELLRFDTVEHYYQSAKAYSHSMAQHVRLSATPGKAKRAGREVRLHPKFEGEKLAIMRYALEKKFTHDTESGRYLLDTGDNLLVEGNTWNDRFWGVCQGVGQNWLGHLLMARRAELRASGMFA